MTAADARDGTAARCERCGASLSLSHAGRARCLFCLHDQPLPAGIIAPLEEHEELARSLGVLRQQLHGAGRGRWYFLALVAVMVPGAMCAAAGIFQGAWSARGDALAAAMFSSIGVLGVLPFVGVPFLWLRVQSSTRARQLAALPVSTPVVRHERVTSDCPSCGAPHAPDPRSLTARCRHCATEALLPLPLVDARLARQHAAIVDVRARGEAEADAAKAAVAAWQRMIKPLMLGFSILFFIVMLAFIAAAELR
ncbi:MAG: hypothetical protein M3Y87_06590 [Myxococcota bacterium]|nr:hypothetical protein [Myxococcota bacterium]